MSRLNFGDAAAQKVSERIAGTVATLAALKAIGARNRVHGMLALQANGNLWRFHSTSALTGDDLLVVAPTAGTGRWLLKPGAAQLVIPFTFATADAAVLLTVPAGCRIRPKYFSWAVSTSFTGGAASAIGVSSTKAGYTAKGDLLGGVGGDVAATLVSTGAAVKTGTIGTTWDTVADKHAGLWLPADILRFDRIVSAFTAGVGSVNVECDVLLNDGA